MIPGGSDRPRDPVSEPSGRLVRADRLHWIAEVALLVLLFFVYGGDRPPMVNESHYLVKAKNFWDPQWCASDLLASSPKAHVVFYAVFGWLTKFVSLESTAWIGRLVGWSLLAIGLRQLSWNLFHQRYLSLVVAVVWIAGIEYGNLAGEWVVGGIEAKVPAYGFVLLGLSEMVRRRWNRVWLLLGIASAFHVLTGGWSVVAAAITWWCTERGQPDQRRFFTPALVAGGLIALFGLVPAIALTVRADPEESTVAARIYTYYRITHHLLPADFRPSWYLRHGLLIGATAWLASLYRFDPGIRRLGAFTLGAVLIALIGLALGVLPSFHPDLAAKLLRYYWFRLTDAAVPLMLGVCVARMLDDGRRPALHRVAGIAVGIAVMLVAGSSYRTGRLKIPPSVSNDLLGFDVGASVEKQQEVYRDWLAVCRWAKQSSNPERGVSHTTSSANIQVVRRARRSGELEGCPARRQEPTGVESAVSGNLSATSRSYSRDHSVQGSTRVPSPLWCSLDDRRSASLRRQPPAGPGVSNRAGEKRNVRGVRIARAIVLIPTEQMCRRVTHSVPFLHSRWSGKAQSPVVAYRLSLSEGRYGSK